MLKPSIYQSRGRSCILRRKGAPWAPRWKRSRATTEQIFRDKCWTTSIFPRLRMLRVTHDSLELCKALGTQDGWRLLMCIENLRLL